MSATPTATSGKSDGRCADKRTLENLWGCRDDDDVPMLDSDLQWLHERLRERTDFRHIGSDSWRDERVTTNWDATQAAASMVCADSQPPRSAQPLHPIASHEVDIEDLEDLTSALFASEDEEEFPLDNGDETGMDNGPPLNPQDIAEDGWPRWLKRVDFTQVGKTPFKVRFLFQSSLELTRARS